VSGDVATCIPNYMGILSGSAHNFSLIPFHIIAGSTLFGIIVN